jgi:hypothetical protein
MRNEPDPITAVILEDADILIVTDTKWRDRLARFVNAAFSAEHPLVQGLKDVMRALNQTLEQLETDMTPQKQDQLAQMLRPMFEKLIQMMPSEPPPPTPAVQ